MRRTQNARLHVRGEAVDYRLVHSSKACKLRVRVGLAGVEVVSPENRSNADIETFLRINEGWISDQLQRIERFRQIRRPQKQERSEILYRGTPTPVEVEVSPKRAGPSRITYKKGCLTIYTSFAPRTSAARSLENWLRKQARQQIEIQLSALTQRLKQCPRRVYIMGQRTKWGNCSRLRNLSFNWRLIMAPDYVLRYLVTHEAVHLAIPDHSRKFWLTVQSLCPETERARQWLCANTGGMLADIAITMQTRIAS